MSGTETGQNAIVGSGTVASGERLQLESRVETTNFLSIVTLDAENGDDTIYARALIRRSSESRGTEAVAVNSDSGDDTGAGSSVDTVPDGEGWIRVDVSSVVRLTIEKTLKPRDVLVVEFDHQGDGTAADRYALFYAGTAATLEAARR